MPRGRPKGSKNKPKNNITNPPTTELKPKKFTLSDRPINRLEALTDKMSLAINQEESQNNSVSDVTVDVEPTESKLTESKLTESKLTELKRGRKKEDYPLCDRCHEPIPSGLTMINLNYVTCSADYHRDLISDRPKLCMKCLKGLNEAIVEYLKSDGKGGKGMKGKFEIEKLVRDDVEVELDKKEIKKEVEKEIKKEVEKETESDDFDW